MQMPRKGSTCGLLGRAWLARSGPVGKPAWLKQDEHKEEKVTVGRVGGDDQSWGLGLVFSSTVGFETEQ